MTAYDAAFQEYVRGRASLADVWAADPYDDALREMARRYYQGKQVREEKHMGQIVDFVKRQYQGLIAGFALGALFVSVLGHLRPPA